MTAGPTTKICLPPDLPLRKKNAASLQVAAVSDVIYIYLLYTTCGSIILLYSPRPIQCLNSVARNVTPEDFRLQDTKKPSSIIVPSNSSVMQGRDLHNPTFLRHAMLRLAPCPPRVHVCRLVAVNPHTSTLYI